MTGLYIILGIILFFVILFSFKVSVIVEMNKNNKIILKYLFLKITILDSSKPKKEKKAKANKKTQEEKNNAEVASAQPETQEADKGGNNLFKQLYIEQGYDGIVKMLSAVKTSLGSFFSKLYKTFTINELYLTMRITGSDAADTAIKYGKISSWLFPTLGKIASTCKMKKYDIDISPDFIGVKNEAEIYLDVSVVPIRITNAAIVLAVQLLFKVILKILFAGNKAKKNVNINKQNNQNDQGSTGELTVETKID